MSARTEAAGSPPVFLDETGRRQRVVRWTGTAVGALILGYLALVVASFARAPFVQHLALPGVGSPAIGPAARPPSLGDNVLTSPAPDLRVTVPATTTTTRATLLEARTTTPSTTATTAARAPAPATTVVGSSPGNQPITTTTVASPPTSAQPGPSTTIDHSNGRVPDRTTTTNPRRP